jgi:transcription elongation factor Elf1
MSAAAAAASGGDILTKASRGVLRCGACGMRAKALIGNGKQGAPDAAVSFDQ